MNERLTKALHERRGFRKLQAEEIFLKSGFRHAEAYCLMTYIGYDPVSCQEVREVMWNSRDGVTPFCIHHRSGWEMDHKEWGKDLCCPLHVPMIGDRVFVDMTLERATKIAKLRVEQGWGVDHGGYKMSDMFESREDAVEKLAAQFLGPADDEGHHGTPDVVVVDERLQQLFIDRRLKALAALS